MHLLSDLITIESRYITYLLWDCAMSGTRSRNDFFTSEVRISSWVRLVSLHPLYEIERTGSSGVSRRVSASRRNVPKIPDDRGAWGPAVAHP
jgi:hypothetical protein